MESTRSQAQVVLCRHEITVFWVLILCVLYVLCKMRLTESYFNEATVGKSVLEQSGLANRLYH